MTRINKKVKTFWGISEVGFSIMYYMEVSFFMFFLTDVAQLPMAMVGTITGVSAFLDAIGAVFAGVIIDKMRFKVGRFRPWLLYCPPIVTLFFIFCFTKIGGDVVAGIIIGIGYVVSHFLWQIAWTANRNVMQLMTEDPDESTYLSARLALGQSLGKILSSYLVPTLSVAFLAMFTGVTAYTVTAFIACLTYIVCYFIHYKLTKEYDFETSAEAKKSGSLGELAKNALGNPNLIALVIHDIIRMTSYYTIAATMAYYAKAILNDPSVTAWMLIMFHVGATIGAYFAAKVAGKFGVKKTTALGLIGCSVFMAICYFMPANVWIIAVFLLLAQICFGIAFALTARLYAMCGTYGLWKTGVDARGLTMSLCGTSAKVSVALRGVLIPAVLTWIAYDATATTFTDATMTGIKMLFLGVAAIGMIIALIPLAMFRLNESKVVEMEKEIKERTA